MRPVHQYNNDGCLCRRFPAVWHHGHAKAILPESVQVLEWAACANTPTGLHPDVRCGTVPVLLRAEDKPQPHNRLYLYL